MQSIYCWVYMDCNVVAKPNRTIRNNGESLRYSKTLFRCDIKLLSTARWGSLITNGGDEVEPAYEAVNGVGEKLAPVLAPSQRKGYGIT